MSSSHPHRSRRTPATNAAGGLPAPFSEPVRAWFAARLGKPTPIQAAAWPRIAAGEHLLVTAPTGSGKTLAAFLWSIDRLVSGDWSGGGVRVIYVSPLKALANDIRRNLLVPLAELPEHCRSAGLPIPDVRVAVRSGDTSEEERRRMLRQPPDILVTTPESLNLMLLSGRWRHLLTEVRTVILDEVHALVGAKRGLHLMTAVERLVRTSGEFQRLALSATVEPAERVAGWVGGRFPAREGAPSRRRPVGVISVPSDKRYDLEVRTTGALVGPGGNEDAWVALAAELRTTIRRNRSTLVFANSRRMVERLARTLNEDASDALVWSHHGSLSREVRSVVEERLKAGELRAIVATNSLELGIDVGTIDEVALVQAPPTIASTVQRLGRAGHSVGAVSRGRLYPTHPRDLLQAAVLGRAVLDGELEPVRPVAGALDVLAQVIVAMCVVETWRTDALYEAVRTADGYADLPRRHFDLVLDMLSGRFATTRLRSLRPLVILDPVDGTVRARVGVERLLYLSGGTIPDRGYFQLRLEGSGAPLGELDEEFVWERAVGDTFTLGVQSWRVERITHNDVFVVPARSQASMAPFWRADERDRSFFLSERVGRLLERIEGWIDGNDAARRISAELPLSSAAAAELVASLRAQRAATGALPHRHRIVVEHTSAMDAGSDHRRVVFHTLWGGHVNRPMASVLSTRWHERFGTRPEVVHDDDCIALTFPADQRPDDILKLFDGAGLEEALRRELEGTGFFGARFREAAATALLLPRAGFRRRTPLWLHRLRAKELLDAVSSAGDFPLALEAWRTCLQDEFDLEALRSLLEEIRDGVSRVLEVRTETPSPFAANVLWRETNALMYADDAASSARRGGLRGDLVRELATSSALRPRLSAELVERLEAKLQRRAPGWTPRDGDDLGEWVRERLLIPISEWEALVTAMRRDHGAEGDAAVTACADRVVTIAEDGDDHPWGVVHVAELPGLAASLGRDPHTLRLGPTGPESDSSAATAALARLLRHRRDGDDAPNLTAVVSQWLRAYGPRPVGAVAQLLRLEPDLLSSALTSLAQDEEVVLDLLTADTVETEVSDRENLERALRMARSAARPELAPLPAASLPLFLACHQGLGVTDASIEDLRAALEPLLGLGLPAELWETEILPARVSPYHPSWLDTLLADTDLEWFGAGPRRVAFTLGGERELALDPAPRSATQADALLPHPLGRFGLDEIVAHTGLASAEVTARVWAAAWRGELSTVGFDPVRRGAATRFRVGDVAPSEDTRRPRRGTFDRWRSSRPFSSAWYRQPLLEPLEDALDREQHNAERARLLVDRYGVLFRELLGNELPAFTWSALFRSLRLLELSGDLVSGRFFEGIQSLQFASPSAVRQLLDRLPEDRVWWFNAADPASPCGRALEGLAGTLPRRVATSHLVCHGSRVVVVSEGRGRRLDIRVAPDHPQLTGYLEFLKVQLARAVRPISSLFVETVNGEPAATSPFRPSLEAVCLAVRSGTGLRLSRRY